MKQALEELKQTLQQKHFSFLETKEDIRICANSFSHTEINKIMTICEKNKLLTFVIGNNNKTIFIIFKE